MTNPLYPVNINYVPGGDISSYVLATPSTWPTTGVTYSSPVYTYPYFVAGMPTVGLFATGSTYTESLANLLLLATASTFVDPGIQPYKRTW